MNDMSMTCFLSVARTGNFTITAKEVSSTQQAVSRNIQSLEEELGFVLLDRSGPSVRLTWEGERFYQWCLDSDRQLSLAVVTAEQQDGKLKDSLRIGWLDWTGCPEPLGKDIRAFMRNYSDCKLEFRQGSTDALASWLRDNLLDVAILPEYNTHNMPGVSVSEPFMQIPLFVTVCDDGSYGDSIPPNRLSAMRYLAVSMGEATEEETRRRIHYSCAAMGLFPEHLDILPDIRSIYAELPCSGSYTIAPRSSYADRWEGLRFFPSEMEPLPLIFASRRENFSPWASLFEAFIRDQRRKDA